MTPQANGIRIACLAVHPPRLAATRLRLTQFFPDFANRGIEAELWTFLRERDLAHWYGRSTLARLAVVARALTRIPKALLMIRRAELVIVQRECLPFRGSWLERWASRKRPLVWDVDDFVWEHYTSPTAGRITRRLRTSTGKHAAICRMASEVWAGSALIAEWATLHNPNTVEVPTVVDVPAEVPQASRQPAAVWVGSHSTAPFLEQILPALDDVARLGSVVAVGAGSLHVWPQRIPLIEQAWSPEIEHAACESSRVGLYPVDNRNVYADGKCGLKAVLYMSHGLPCVVTPTPPNAAIVRDGVDGLYANTPAEWTAAVDRLLSDEALWHRCSREGHRRARDLYSLQVWAPRLTDRICNLGGPGHP